MSETTTETTTETSITEITDLLRRWTDGEDGAFAQLAPRIYERLRALAHHLLLSERRDHTLEPTELLHEVFIELSQEKDLEFSDQSQFYGLAACLMRRALVDYSRRHSAVKRGGGIAPISLTEDLSSATPRPEALVALDDALISLEKLDSAMVRLIELRYFAGLTIDQIADQEGVSSRTIARRWDAARALLHRLLTEI